MAPSCRHRGRSAPNGEAVTGAPGADHGRRATPTASAESGKTRQAHTRLQLRSSSRCRALVVALVDVIEDFGEAHV